jgi:hypothetical protein
MTANRSTWQQMNPRPLTRAEVIERLTRKAKASREEEGMWMGIPNHWPEAEKAWADAELFEAAAALLQSDAPARGGEDG